jgi:UDP-glucose 4-epimerase
MKKILVTGGAGFIGAHLVDRLLKLKYKVMVVDNLKTIGGIPYINPKCLFVKGNILENKTLKIIEKWKPKIIFHLAAQSGGESAYDNPKYDYLTNGYGTYLISLLAKKIKLELLVYASSVAVYGSNKNKIFEDSKINPESIYGISKYIGEMFIRQILYPTNIRTVIFRLFNTFGPGENLNFLKKGMVSIYASYLWKKKPILVKGSLSRFRNFNYIDDCINIFLKSIHNKNLNKNEVFNLTSSKLIKIKNLIKIMLNVSNKKNHKIIVKAQTKGDSFGYNGSNAYLRKKFNNYNFLTLKSSLTQYFKWINKIPVSKDLKKYHPLHFDINKK